MPLGAAAKRRGLDRCLPQAGAAVLWYVVRSEATEGVWGVRSPMDNNRKQALPFFGIQSGGLDTKKPG